MPSRREQHTPAEVLAAGAHSIREVLQLISRFLTNDPDTALSEVLAGRDRKKALRLDLYAEDSFALKLHSYKAGAFADIVVYGEERLRDRALDLTTKTGVFALVDAVDGTDLVERGLGNWCSAAVFFAPKNAPGTRILCAVVGFPNGDLYYAVADDAKAWLRQGTGVPQQLAGPSSVTALAEASLSFYGQKTEHFLSATDLMRSIDGRSKSFRVYNLAGIPMMVKLANHGKNRECRGIDAVIELLGQKPHDLVAGAFIAKKADAILLRPDGREITDVELEEMLFRPAAEESEQKYVLAATGSLANEICHYLGSPPDREFVR